MAICIMFEEYITVQINSIKVDIMKNAKLHVNFTCNAANTKQVVKGTRKIIFVV